MTVQWGVTTPCVWCHGRGCTRNGEPCGSCRGAGFTDGSVAPVRRDDPETSRAAAESVNLNAGQQYVLDILQRFGPCTDQELYDHLTRLGYPISDSGARTRRSELVGLGKVVDTGKRDTLQSGRRAVRWAAR